MASLLLLVACERTPVEPPLPYGSTEMSPPVAYERWWHEVEACAQVIGDYQAVRWYAVQGSTAFTYDGDKGLEGMWLPSGNRIFIAGILVDDSLLVRHEELHALLQSVQHPPLFFQSRCGAIVL